MTQPTGTACSTCEDEGWACYPHADNRRIECPGEECGTCDYAWTDDDEPADHDELRGEIDRWKVRYHAEFERARAAEQQVARVQALCERLEGNGGAAYPRVIRNHLAGLPSYA